MTATLARTAEVSRRFGNFTAVHSVSIAVQPAEVVGLLGANGAGKTTLIRLLLGLVRPSSGEVELLGRAPSVATRRRVGYVPQSLGLYVDLTAGENWDFTAAAFGSPRLPLPALVASVRDELGGPLPLGTQRRVRSCWSWTRRRPGSVPSRGHACGRTYARRLTPAPACS